MKDVFVVDALRTPIGKFGGALSSIRPDDLAAFTLKKIAARNTWLDLNEVEEVILGAANQSGEDNRNVARMAVLLAGWPVSVGGVTVNRLCASGLQAIADAYRCIASGHGSIYVAGGVESMSRAPYVLSKATSPFDRNQQMFDTALGWRFTNPSFSKEIIYSMGETAENVARKWNISREEQDVFALSSQQKYAAAHQAGKFDDELEPIEFTSAKGSKVIVDKDEHPRSTSLEELSKLKPAFVKDGTVTAGNSSGINDGAAALLLASEDVVKRTAIKPLAKIVAVGAAGVEPAYMGIGPVPATRKALQRAGLQLHQIGLVELNEAFASQSLACIRDLGLNPEIVNVNGGAIALGHPLGCSGARISATLLHEMKRRTDVRYGLATMCIGVGQGLAIIYERC
ncbi:MAG: acetyl-CoA C-acyltransferase [Chitinophagales bacterium]|nr:acetyl-CoA C-acyltransferase [Chitinophagales bacterium]MDW8273800.1 acetyl-CoA C-acyltransferase [Chitinophagales bacterium]